MPFDILHAFPAVVHFTMGLLYISIVHATLSVDMIASIGCDVKEVCANGNYYFSSIFMTLNAEQGAKPNQRAKQPANLQLATWNPQAALFIHWCQFDLQLKFQIDSFLVLMSCLERLLFPLLFSLAHLNNFVNRKSVLINIKSDSNDIFMLKLYTKPSFLGDLMNASSYFLWFSM